MLLQNKQGTSDIEPLYYLVMLLYGIFRGRCVCQIQCAQLGEAGESEELHVRD